MNYNEERKDKPVFKTMIETEDALYEMVYDRIKNKSFYVKMDRHGHIDSFLEEVELNGYKYRPLPPTYNLVDKKIILFPSLAAPYENEEEILNEIRTFIHVRNSERRNATFRTPKKDRTLLRFCKTL